ncbi:MAG: ABC transporter permease subunit [Planctomycetes bacterium]|nr:ABC transporter permease subunit [Planctomycetota bacterium]
MSPGARNPIAWLVGLPAAAAVALFALPLLGIVLRAPWDQLFGQLASPAVHDAMRLSLLSSGGALALAVVLGLPLAVWLASGDSVLRSAARLVVMLPIVLPPVVGGIALLLAYGRAGVVGGWLDRAFGVTLPFSTAGAALAAAYMGMPFFVLAVEAGLRAFDRRHLAAAATLGAGPVRRFVTVTLPMIRPSLQAGVLLCWARALGEFCATQTFAGNLSGTTRTMPLACGVAMETDPDLAIVLSLILSAVSLAVLFVLRRRWLGAR